MRGTTTSSPSRSARRTALATIVSWFVTERRTDTPERWLMCGLWRASCENVDDDLGHELGDAHVHAGGGIRCGRASWATIAISVSTSSG